MSADTDVSRAFLEKWKSTKAITDVVPGGLVADRLPRPDASPYASYKVEQGPKANEYSTGGSFIDYRKVTITLYGVGKEVVGTIVSTIKATFDNPATLDFAFSPDVLAHMRTEPLPDVINIEDQQKAGDDVRSAVIGWCVWTHRLRG